MWAIYLDFTYWGICVDEQLACRLTSLQQLQRALRVRNSADVYLVLSIILFAFAILVRPNAVSLYTLYRDRLERAFLPGSLNNFRNGALRERILLSQLSGRHGLYHLLNATLNIRHSTTTNRRGRTADFFLFSPHFVGSRATGYVSTQDLERIEPGLDLSTAMAISGVRASSQIGARAIKPMLLTLAILNLRFGFWLQNPAKMRSAGARYLRSSLSSVGSSLYVLLEICGLLDESRKSVFLTNGGEVENLGIYELLRRQCTVIIAVDAEADPEMAFGSFSTMLRYASIDLGIEINLPWQQISHSALRASYEIDRTGDVPSLKGRTVRSVKFHMPTAKRASSFTLSHPSPVTRTIT